MLRLYLLITLALLTNEALGFRIKRQSEDSEEANLDDRYGWNRPGRFPNQGQFPGQGFDPTQGRWRYPQNQIPNSWFLPEPQYPVRFPWQNPQNFPEQNTGFFPGQNTGIFPGQNPGNFPGQNPGNFPGQNPGNFPGQNPGNFPGQNPGNFPGQNPGNFPGQNPGNFPGQNPGQGSSPVPDPGAATTQAPNSGTTTQNIVIQDCIRTCPVTPEYNPVCGSNNVTYDNPGRLLCAQLCGIAVTQTRTARCPNAVTAPPA